MNFNLGTISIGIKSGALIPVLLMLPNVVWMLLPKTGSARQVPEALFLTIVENAGRLAVLILPFFYSLDVNTKLSLPVMIGTGLALAIYYGSWLRYFAGGRPAELLRAPLLGVPLPLAVTPVVFLIFSSFLMGSWLMLVASIWFGIAHIWVSALTL
jgi:hypothetical protein